MVCFFFYEFIFVRNEVKSQLEYELHEFKSKSFKNDRKRHVIRSSVPHFGCNFIVRFWTKYLNNMQEMCEEYVRNH